MWREIANILFMIFVRNGKKMIQQDGEIIIHATIIKQIRTSVIGDHNQNQVNEFFKGTKEGLRHIQSTTVIQ